MWKKLLYIFSAIVLCSLCCLSISEPVNAVDIIYRPGIAAGIKLAGPDATEIQRKYYNDTTIAQLLNTGSANFQYMRLYFDAFNPNNRDFSLTFMYSTLVDDTPLEVNVLGAFNVNITQTKISGDEFAGTLNNQTGDFLFNEMSPAVMVNITGNLAIDYYGTSTDHIDLYVGLHKKSFELFRPMAVISEDNILNDEMNFRHWVQNYLENLDLDFDVSAIVNAQEDTTSAIEDTTDAVNNPEYIQQEKQDLEDSQTDLSDEATDASGEAESNTTNLTTAIGQVIDAFRNAQPSDCNLTMNMGNFNLGTVNMCNAPSQILTTINLFLGIPLTIAVLHIAYTTLTRYLNAIRKEQE